jgi:hypothetical protein
MKFIPKLAVSSRGTGKLQKILRTNSIAQYSNTRIGVTFTRLSTKLRLLIIPHKNSYRSQPSAYEKFHLITANY